MTELQAARNRLENLRFKLALAVDEEQYWFKQLLGGDHPELMEKYGEDVKNLFKEIEELKAWITEQVNKNRDIGVMTCGNCQDLHTEACEGCLTVTNNVVSRKNWR